MSNFKTFCTNCVLCNGATSKAYARKHDGLCKSCVTGVPTDTKEKTLCPDCGEHYLTPYQLAHHYHCDHCTREADPIGHYNEMTQSQEPSY